MKKKEPQILEAVAERDVDLLLLEELTVNPEFLEWWLQRVGATEHSGASVIRSAHSVTRAGLGESDFEIVYSLPGSERIGLLIEDKISAPPQPDQGKRYGSRGKAGAEARLWETFLTCIVAPQSYLDSSADAAHFGARLSYEDVRDWFADRSSDPRAQYRARILQEAINQNRRGWSPEIDERVTEFQRRYWMCASEEFPELELPDPGPRPAGAGWIRMHPESLRPGVEIIHKLADGAVDLQLDGAADDVEKIEHGLQPFLGSDTSVVVTGKSASVRVRVPSLDRFGEFDKQIANARAGMKAAYRLLFIDRAIPDGREA